MARLLALEWDAREARVVVARTRGTSALIEQAFSVDLGPRDPGQTFADQNVGAQVGAALAARGIAGGDALVAVGRASIELRQLTLPPAPEAELPDMVRFQALRQFTNIGDDWPLDYLPLESRDEETLEVLAATISPDLVEQIRTTCEAGDIIPRRLVLRPFAAASLIRRFSSSDSAPCRLLVDLLSDEADLTVTVQQQVVLVRTVRLASTEDSQASARALVGEIRRTMAAAHNQLRQHRVQEIVLCGDGQDQAVLQKLLAERLDQPITCVDPFEGLPLTPELRKHRPEHAERFAPLLGMIMDEAAGERHGIDFLHPRRREEPVSPHRRWLIIAGSVAACALLVFLLLWLRLNSLDNEIADKTQRRQSQQKAVERAEAMLAQVNAVEDYVSQNVNWIDEIYAISKELPPAEDVLITQVTLSLRSGQGGEITLEGYAREASDIPQISQRLRRTGRPVITTGITHDERQKEYQWRFKETLIIQPQPAIAEDAPEAEPSDVAKND